MRFLETRCFYQYIKTFLRYLLANQQKWLATLFSINDLLSWPVPHRPPEAPACLRCVSHTKHTKFYSPTKAFFFFFFFEILSYLNQAVPDHLANESQTRQPDTSPDHPQKMIRWCIRLTCLTLICEVIRYRLVQVWQNLKKKKNFWGWRPAIAFLYLFLFHSLLCLSSFLSQYKQSILIWPSVTFNLVELQTSNTTYPYSPSSLISNYQQKWRKMKILPAITKHPLKMRHVRIPPGKVVSLTKRQCCMQTTLILSSAKAKNKVQGRELKFKKPHLKHMHTSQEQKFETPQTFSDRTFPT